MTEQNNGEAETRKSLAEGYGITFPNAQEAIKWLKGEPEQELREMFQALVEREKEEKE